MGNSGVYEVFGWLYVLVTVLWFLNWAEAGFVFLGPEFCATLFAALVASLNFDYAALRKRNQQLEAQLRAQQYIPNRDY